MACNLILEYTLSVAVCARAATAYFATLLGLQPEAALIRLGAFSLDICAVLLIAALGTLLALGTKESATFNSGALVASWNLQAPFLCMLVSLFHASRSLRSPKGMRRHIQASVKTAALP